MARYRVLHFARVINRHDFIDHVVRFADPSRFHMMACTLSETSNIEPPRYAEAGVPHWVIRGRRRLEYPATILQLARLLRAQRVDVLHTHHYDEAFIGALAGRLAGVPVVLGRHYHDELYLAASGAKLRGLLAVEQLCNRLARWIVVPSTAIRDLLVQRQGVPAEKVRVIPYGFDFSAARYQPPPPEEQQALRRSLGLGEAFVLGSFGRLHPLKGQDDLLRAFADVRQQLPQARLLMVGDGPARPALQALARQLGIEAQVQFTGWRHDVSRMLAVVDVVVHPTLHEAFPQLMVEAMAQARPLIITEVSGTTEHVAHGRTGLLIPKQDPHALAEAIVWAARYPAEARAIGLQARDYVRARLDIRSVIRDYECCYEGTRALSRHEGLHRHPRA